MDLAKADTLKMVQDGHPIHKNMIMPKYQMDKRLKVYREVNPPPASLYMGIGYDGAVTDHMPTTTNRHYRKMYNDELENNKEIFNKQVFYRSKVMRGQSRGLKSSFLSSIFGGDHKDESGMVSDLKEVGGFVGHIMIYNEKERDQYFEQK